MLQRAAGDGRLVDALVQIVQILADLRAVLRLLSRLGQGRQGMVVQFKIDTELIDIVFQQLI